MRLQPNSHWLQHGQNFIHHFQEIQAVAKHWLNPTLSWVFTASARKYVSIKLWQWPDKPKTKQGVWKADKQSIKDKEFLVEISPSEAPPISNPFPVQIFSLSAHYKQQNILCISKNTKSGNRTSGMQSSWVTTLTISSRGSSELHLISVYTFLPSVQAASSSTRVMWYAKGPLSSARSRSEHIIWSRTGKDALSL